MDKTIQNFKSLNIPALMRVLVLAPHPDDFDAIGVTLSYLHRQGNPIYIAVLSGSASGVLDSFAGPDKRTKAAAREEEQQKSVKFFGIPVENLTFLRLPEDECGDPIENRESEESIRTCFESISPAIIFLPHGNDTNKGHQRNYSMFRRIAESSGRTLQVFYIRDPKTTRFCTDVYMAFDEESARWKRKLLLHHKSQEHRNRELRGAGFDDRLINVNHKIAEELGLKESYAEAFEHEIFQYASS